MKVRVYRNLHRKMYSIQTYIKGKGWRVTGHAESVTLANANFVVNDAGRERVRREKRKNVHAYVIGTLTTLPDPYSFQDCANRVSYDPYEMDSFEMDNGRDWEPVYKARYAQLTLKGAWAV
jgi:hypothetical protein